MFSFPRRCQLLLLLWCGAFVLWFVSAERSTVLCCSCCAFQLEWTYSSICCSKLCLSSVSVIQLKSLLHGVVLHNIPLEILSSPFLFVKYFSSKSGKSRRSYRGEVDSSKCCCCRQFNWIQLISSHKNGIHEIISLEREIKLPRIGYEYGILLEEMLSSSLQPLNVWKRLFTSFSRCCIDYTGYNSYSIDFSIGSTIYYISDYDYNKLPVGLMMLLRLLETFMLLAAVDLLGKVSSQQSVNCFLFFKLQ